MWWSLALNLGDQFAAHAQSWKRQQEQLLHQYCQRWGRYLTVVFGAWYGRVEQQRALFDASNQTNGLLHPDIAAVLCRHAA